MNVKQLKELIAHLPDDLPVHVNDVQAGKYSDEDIDAFFYVPTLKSADENALVITVGDTD